MNEYINISKASSSSLVEKAGASTAFNSFIPIKEIAQAKGLKSTRSIRMEINKPESKYISREVKVNGGMSYEILFSSLEPELQQKLRECETKSTAIVPLNYKPPVITDKARQTANHRMNIVKAALEHRNKYPTIKQADAEFLDLYNSGLYLPKAYEFLGSISIGTLRRYIQAYKKTGNAESLIPQYKITKQGEYNSILDDNMKKVLLALLLHQNKFGYNTAIRLAKQVLIKKGYDEDALPSNITFKRFAEHFRKNNYAEWVLRREGIRSALDKALSEGKTFKEFQKELKPTLQKKGWWGEQIVVDTQGNAEKVQLGSMYRLKTIYAVNMQTSYMTGRYKTQMDNVDNRPYWEYVAVLDNRTRPEHAQLHGLIYRYDDPFWASFYPPNGWRCRCRVNALSNYNLKKKDAKPGNSIGTLSQEMRLVSKKSGEYKPVTVYTDPLTGKKIAPDVGWSHNPASGLNDI